MGMQRMLMAEYNSDGGCENLDRWFLLKLGGVSPKCCSMRAGKTLWTCLSEAMAVPLKGPGSCKGRRASSAWIAAMEHSRQGDPRAGEKMMIQPLAPFCISPSHRLCG
jgi:hypothetical protein